MCVFLCSVEHGVGSTEAHHSSVQRAARAAEEQSDGGGSGTGRHGLRRQRSAEGVRRARRAVIDRDRLYSPFANMLRTLRPQHKHIPGQNPCWFIDCTQGYEHFAHTDDVSKSVGH